MDIDVFEKRDLQTIFRALRTALRPEGLLDARERAFLGTYAKTYGLALAGPDPLPLASSRVSGMSGQKFHWCVTRARCGAAEARVKRDIGHAG